MLQGVWFGSASSRAATIRSEPSPLIQADDPALFVNLGRPTLQQLQTPGLAHLEDGERCGNTPQEDVLPAGNGDWAGAAANRLAMVGPNTQVLAVGSHRTRQ